MLDALRTHFLRKMAEDSVRDVVSGIKLCNNVRAALSEQLAVVG